MEYEEYAGWAEYFRRRPPGWREDNRAAIIAMSFGGSNLKPEKLFHSLKVIKQESEPPAQNFAQQFISMFKHRMTEELPFDDTP